MWMNKLCNSVDCIHIQFNCQTPSMFVSALLQSCATKLFQPVLKPNNCSLFSSSMSKKSAILLLANGTEEMEAVITIDILRRAGINVTISSIGESECIKCSRDVKICADAKFEAVKHNQYDAIILPGGLAGSKAFCSSAEVGDLLKKQENEGKLIAAICAAPTALKAHKIGIGKQITSYPSMKDQLTDDYKYVEDTVVTDGNIITSRGPATACAFGLAIVEKLLDKNSALTVAKGMLYADYK